MQNIQADARIDRTPPPLLRLPSVMRMTGLGRSTIYRMITKQQFPSPVRLGIRAVAWRHSDLSSWIDERTPAP